MITSVDYYNRLKSRKPTLYMFGEKVDVPVDHPQLKTNFNAVAVSYDMALKPEYEDLMTVVSPITGKRVNRYNHPYMSADDLLKKVDMIRTMVSQTGCPCVCRCVGSDALSTIGITSYDVDKALGTNYYQRYLEYLKYFQENDLTASGAVTDAKGDRSLRPHQQPDPDLYVHVVDKREDGIIVRGAKTSITNAAICDEIVVIPGRGLTEKDAAYAVAFAIPADTKGIVQIATAKSPRPGLKMEGPIARRYAFSDSMIIFEDVFVPWERVFLCGEWQFGAGMGSLFGNFHRLSHCGCIPGRGDMLTGATSLIAKYNGIRDKGHVRSKLVDLITSAETVYACGITAAVKGVRTPSGLYQPATIYSNTGKLIESENTTAMITPVADICGGLLTTMPSEADYFSEATHQYMKRYLKGASNLKAEDRIKAIHLVADLTVTRHAAGGTVAEVMGAGSPEAQRRAIHDDYDFEKREKVAKMLANIGD
ncbi:MAG: 4-hydroxyphenylacetate 3-hydroxylase N-terminal domain-containing protein [Smithellaceae bacterium]|nr:4-hydroxybutyryl-CoA dehydratase [Syntrophaceae bacterium]MBP8609778.1 4-hydroxybutyryl-CoA dehydratase [Syntrophaceae bacterium]HNT91591.1 4-hydroxyphenylacetate 3-hydroxylase N-terminal domain-containing protein [Smithellaceae bacterium]HOD31279.1 4-hydroxyphenylacetate 3-hydroxylase N-terminal domain-containing protein [Smithellaceae bacterium]